MITSKLQNLDTAVAVVSSIVAVRGVRIFTKSLRRSVPRIKASDDFGLVRAEFTIALCG